MVDVTTFHSAFKNFKKARYVKPENEIHCRHTLVACRQRTCNGFDQYMCKIWSLWQENATSRPLRPKRMDCAIRDASIVGLPYPCFRKRLQKNDSLKQWVCSCRFKYMRSSHAGIWGLLKITLGKDLRPTEDCQLRKLVDCGRIQTRDLEIETTWC